MDRIGTPTSVISTPLAQLLDELEHDDEQFGPEAETAGEGVTAWV
jgi:hypothetical protein